MKAAVNNRSSSVMPAPRDPDVLDWLRKKSISLPIIRVDGDPESRLVV